MKESPLGYSTERRPPDIRLRAVLQVAYQVEQDDGVAVLALDLEDALDRVTPAEQHLPVAAVKPFRPATNRSTTVEPSGRRYRRMKCSVTRIAARFSGSRSGPAASSRRGVNQRSKRAP